MKVLVSRLFVKGLFLLLVGGLCVGVCARDANARQRAAGVASQQMPEDVSPDGPPAPGRGASLLMRLNLTPEQRAQIREIKRQSLPEARALLQRLRAARRALDEAIYADQDNEALIEERAGALASAQASVIRMRALTELRVRRVLTPEQLQLFRQLRQQARPAQPLRRESGGRFGERDRRAPMQDNLNRRMPEGSPAETSTPSRPRRRPARLP